MKEMMLLAGIVPVEVIINFIKEAITSYEEAKLLNKSEKEIKELENKVTGMCHMLVMKNMAGNTPESMLEALESLDKAEKANNLLNIDKSN